MRSFKVGLILRQYSKNISALRKANIKSLPVKKHRFTGEVAHRKTANKMFFRGSLSMLKITSGVHHMRSATTKQQSIISPCLIDVHPLVQSAIASRQPIVALESTIITHGMPHPQNLETAKEVEDLVRLNGATPATIAILNGRIKVGLSDCDLAKLASKKQSDVIKCSRRDLPYVVANEKSGGTTVAATMLLAHMLGLRIFATGGIGGVHRGGHISMDVSADLVELGRTPVAVVCSGVKSILDIPRTLEFLETQGVCVATYGSNEGRFPDFYTRDSGHKVPYNLQGPAHAARLIEALESLQLKSGILIGVPIPEAFAADKAVIDQAIEQANKEAEQLGIKGKQVTPFLLAAIAKITGGASLASNIALIKNNAAVAARIAREMCSESSYHVPGKIVRAPVIIGASIMDLSLTLQDDFPTVLDGATYQTQAKESPGGVGRNLAEGIFKLHGNANFISVVGNDEMGKSILNLMPAALKNCVQIDKKSPTSLCSVILDKRGDCKLILGNMEIHERLTPERVRQKEDLLLSAPLIIMDGNLSLPTMEYVLEIASAHKRPVFFEPTDMRIAGKPFTLARSLTKQIKIVSPNINELKSIVEAITKAPLQWEANMSIQTAALLLKVQEILVKVQDHFDCILVTLGHHGVLLSVRGAQQKPLFDAETGEYLIAEEGSPTLLQPTHSLRFYAAPKVHNIINVSGAGDSFSSGFITGLLRGYTVERSVAFGFISAERALKTVSAVPKSYFADDNEESNNLENVWRGLQTIDLDVEATAC